jgi:hypothetical protein
MTKSGRQLLIDCLKKKFLPFVTAQGWISEGSRPEYDSPALRKAFPFGYFRRRMSTGVQSFDIYFDKRSPKFQVAIGTIPANGMLVDIDLNAEYPGETWNALVAPDARILRPGFLFGTFFGYRLFHPPTLTEAERVVAQLTKLWPQVEDYFVTGRVGPNLIEGSGLTLARQRAKLAKRNEL